jgi:hypothetical protein
MHKIKNGREQAGGITGRQCEAGERLFIMQEETQQFIKGLKFRPFGIENPDKIPFFGAFIGD